MRDHPAPRPTRALRVGLTALTATAVLVLPPSGPALAADDAADTTQTAQWSIAPADSLDGGPRGAITYTIEPGTAVTDEVRVTNLGEEELALEIYAADAVATADGTFTVAPAAEEPTDLGAWISAEATSVELAPGESRDVPITISVPANATPGDHAAGILAARRTGDDAAILSVDQRVGSRVLVRVNGALEPRLDVTELTLAYGGAMWPIDRGPARIDYTVTNTGNIRLAGSLTVALRGPLGPSLGSSEAIEVAELLPGGSVHGTIEVTPALPPGHLTAEATVGGLNISGTVPVKVPRAHASVAVWAMPWLALGVLALIVAAWWLRRRRLTRALRAARQELVGLRAVQVEEPAAVR